MAINFSLAQNAPQAQGLPPIQPFSKWQRIGLGLMGQNPYADYAIEEARRRSDLAGRSLDFDIANAGRVNSINEMAAFAARMNARARLREADTGAIQVGAAIRQQDEELALRKQEDEDFRNLTKERDKAAGTVADRLRPGFTTAFNELLADAAPYEPLVGNTQMMEDLHTASFDKMLEAIGKGADPSVAQDRILGFLEKKFADRIGARAQAAREAQASLEASITRMPSPPAVPVNESVGDYVLRSIRGSAWWNQPENRTAFERGIK